MPYSIVSRSDCEGVALVDEAGELIRCFDSRDEAEDFLTALLLSENFFSTGRFKSLFDSFFDEESSSSLVSVSLVVPPETAAKLLSMYDSDLPLDRVVVPIFVLEPPEGRPSDREIAATIIAVQAAAFEFSPFTAQTSESLLLTTPEMTALVSVLLENTSTIGEIRWSILSSLSRLGIEVDQSSPIIPAIPLKEIPTAAEKAVELPTVVEKSPILFDTLELRVGEERQLLSLQGVAEIPVPPDMSEVVGVADNVSAEFGEFARTLVDRVRTGSTTLSPLEKSFLLWGKERSEFETEVESEFPGTVSELIFSEVSEAALSSPVDGAAFPGFPIIDKYGREFVFSPDEAEEYQKNTMELIKHSGVDSSGEFVGLPIDANGSHDFGDAAGWIKNVKVVYKKSPAGVPIKVLQFVVKWTSLGKQKIREGIRKYLSPVIDVRSKTIKGAALTNWPASVDPTGAPLLAPVELSYNLYSRRRNHMTQTTTDVHQQGAVSENVAASLRNLVSQLGLPSDPIAEGAETQAPQDEAILGGVADFLDELELGSQKEAFSQAVQERMLALFDSWQRQALQQTQQAVLRVKRLQRIAQFSTDVTSGSPENPRGLPVSSERLEKFLSTLKGEQLEEAMALFSDIVTHGLVSFSEAGISGEVEVKSPLPEVYDEALRSGKLTVQDLSSPLILSRLGDLNQYDLTPYQQ